MPAPKGKKLAVQELKSSSSSPVPPEVAPLQPSAVVAKAAPPASKKIVKAVIFEYGYPVEGQSYRPVDEFSDDDDDSVILPQTFFSSCCDWVQLFFWIFYFIFRNWRLQNSTKRPKLIFEKSERKHIFAHSLLRFALLRMQDFISWR